MDRDEYIREYNLYHDEFIETIKIDNVYNRLVLFGGDTYHGVRTIGTEERLTIAKKYSLDEIFTYGKGNDISMGRKTMNYYA